MSTKPFSFEEAQKPVDQAATAAQPKTFSFEEASGVSHDGAWSRGWNKTKQSATITGRLLTGDAQGAAQTIKEADDYARNNPGMAEGRDLSDAWQRGDGVLGGIAGVVGEFAKDWREAPSVVGGIRATAKNVRAMGEGLVEQVPNMIAPTVGLLGGTAAGGAAGSAVPLVGNVAGGLVGGWAGASAGNALVEGGGMAQEAISKAGINPQDAAAVEKYLKANGDQILGQAGVKGGIIGAVDVATMGIASKLLNGPARAAASRALADMGVDATNKIAVKAAMETPEFAAKIAGDAAYKAAMTGAGSMARNAGAAAMDPAGEFTGELVGQGVATGDWDTKNAALEAFSSMGQSGVMFAGQKAYQAATRPHSGDAATPPAADPTTSPGAADPTRPDPTPPAAPIAPDWATSPGAAAPNPYGGIDFTREVDTSGLSLADPADTIASRLKPSEVMGLNPQAGALSREVAAFVDAQPFTEVTPIESRPEIGAQRRIGEQPIIDVDAREVIDPQQTIAARLAGPSQTAPIQQAIQQLPYNPATQGDSLADQAPQAIQAATQRTQAGAAQADSGLNDPYAQAWDSLDAESRASVARSAGSRGSMARNVASKGWGDLSPNLRASISTVIESSRSPGGVISMGNQPQGAINVGNTAAPQTGSIPAAAGAPNALAQGERGAGLSGNGDGVGGRLDGAGQRIAGSGAGEAGLAPVAGRAGVAPALTQGAAPILQNRNRSNPSSIAQMQGIAADPDYGRLGFSRDFANGAPVVAGGTVPADQFGRSDVAVASDGRRIPVQYAVVEASDVLASNQVDGTPNADYGNQSVTRIRAIAGNGRIAGLQRAYGMGTSDGYTGELLGDALHGVSPDVIRSMRQPVLVRVMPVDQVTQDIGDVSNTTGNLSLSHVEQANNDAQRVSLDALQFSEDGAITSDTVRQFVRAMPQAEQGGLIDTNGQPTKQAVDRINAAVFARAYGNDQLIRLFAQAQDPEARNVLSALAQVAPKMARLEGAGALDIRDVVTQAAEIAVNARREGRPLANAAAQIDMTADPMVGEVLQLFARNARTVRPVVDALGAAADFAYTEANKPAEDMFGAVPKATRSDVLGSLSPQNEQASQANLEQPAGGEPVQVDAVKPAADAGAAADTPAAEAGRPAEADREALTLEAQTEDDLRAKAEREDAATSQAAAEKAAEQERLRRETEARDNKARADATVDDFQLGQTADQQLSGMDDMFGGAQDAAPAAETDAIEQPAAQDATPTPAAKSTKQAATIEDFGERLEGARKFLPPSLQEDIGDDQIASLPLSKVWPSDAHESIEDASGAALTFAARQEIPAKPRVAYKVRGWVEKVKTFRRIVRDFDGASIELMEKLAQKRGFDSLAPFFAKVKLLTQIPRDTWGRIEKVGEYPDARRGKTAEELRAAGLESRPLDKDKLWLGGSLYRIDTGEPLTMDEQQDEAWVASPFSSVTIDGKTHSFDAGRIGPDEVQKVREILGSDAPKKGGLTASDFEVRGSTKSGYKINRKGDSEYRALKTFTGEGAAKKALAWRDENVAELEAAWEAVKARDNVSKADVRRDENRERTGENRRGGKDVTPEMFEKALGFRGVQFGNWVAQGKGSKDRQGLLNEAYDAMLDLADVLGIPPRAVSLNGSLGLSLGARGAGKASAHFEPSNLVINLTKTRGAGTLAHEWFHALDNYFSRLRGGEVAFTGDQAEYRRSNYITYKPEAAWVKTMGARFTKPLTSSQLRAKLQQLGGAQYDPSKTVEQNAKDAGWQRDPSHKEGVRPEVEKAFVDLVEALNESPMAKRASAMDKAGSDGYWGRIIERGARSFENYVINKLAQRGWSNDFLANVRDWKEWEQIGKNSDRYPYLRPDEEAPIVAAFDALFDVVETRETEGGNVAMFSRRSESGNLKGALYQRGQTITTRDSDAQLTSAQQITDAIAARWKNAPADIIVSRNMQDASIPEAVRKHDAELKSQGATGEPRGFIYKGKVYLLSDQLKTTSDVIEVLFHESLGHYGLRGVFGDSLKSILQQVGSMRRADVVAKAREYGLFDAEKVGENASDRDVWASMTDKQRLDAAEEVLAEMAQTRPDLGFVQRAISAIRNWLRANVPGFQNLRMKNADIVQAYILPARGWVERGGASSSVNRQVANEPGARYSAREQDLLFSGDEAPTSGRPGYETDLFGDPLPISAGRLAPARSAQSGVRGDTQPATGLSDTAAPEGSYRVRTIIGQEVSRKLGADTILTPEQAAQATAYLYRSAVERFDAIVTDKNGKPLAVVGSFKGALTQTSVYPGTVIAEAVRVPGAARIWFSHNHPSGKSALSDADKTLNRTLSSVFDGTSIEPMGTLAVTGKSFEHVSPDGFLTYGATPAPSASINVPVIERELDPGNKDADIILDSPAKAREHGSALYRDAGEPGLMILDAQHRVAAWVPVRGVMKGKLMGTGGLDAVYRAVSESNAGSVIIIHGGELDAGRGDGSVWSIAQNLGAALRGTDVRVLDIIDVNKPRSAAETGADLVARSVFSRTQGATPAQPAAPASAWGDLKESAFDDVIFKMQDKMIDLKRVVESITKSVGAVADNVNAYLQEELFHGRTASRVAEFGNREMKPLMNQMRLAGLTLEDVEEFLHARHAKEANAVIAQRNPGVADMQDGGSGMTNADADAYFANLTPGQRSKLEAAAKKVDAIIADTRKLYVQYGLEDQAVVDGWTGMFKNYIPLMRENKDGGMGIGQGFSVKGKEVKGRTGSKRKVVDIMANIAAQREKVIVRGEKNRVAQALAGLAWANPNKAFWEVRSQAPTERVYDDKLKKVVDRPDPMFKSRDNVLSAKVKDSKGNVTEQFVVFNEDNPRAVRLASAMKNLDAGNLEGLLGVSAKITRYFSAINTQYNPVFGVVNLVRDVQGAMVNLAATPLAGQQAKIAKDTISALSGIYGDIRKTRKGGQAASPWAKLWEQMQEDGGTTGYRELFKTSADREASLKAIINPDAWMDSKWGKVFTADGKLKVPMSVAKEKAGDLFNWLSDYNEAMENGVRLAAYKAALDKGMSRQQAASLSKNLTVNFNRKGQVGMQAGAVYAFFNAAMQGTTRIGQTLFDMEGGDIKTIRLSSVGKKVVYGGVLLGVMQALALSAAGFDDEDPPEFLRERSLIIPTGGKTYISIPMPLGLHVIPGLGRHATEFALSGFSKPAERAVSVVGMFADAFNPIGNAGLSMQTVAPTALDPFVALSENRDWTGKPIARTSFNKAEPGHNQWKDTATGVSKTIAEAINWLSGGNEYVAGAFSPTPDQIDYLIAQVGGGVAREVSKVMQTGSSITSGEELPTYKMPLLGRFVGSANGQASQGSAFYANLNKLNALETEIKGLRKDGKYEEAAALVRERPESSLIAFANKAERDVQKLRRDKRELIANDADRDAVRAKEDQITSVMTRLNELTKKRTESVQ